jgi:flagellar protein FlaG
LPPATPQTGTPTAEQLGKIVSQLQSQVNSSAANLQFSVDHDTGKSVIKVMDTSTNTVIWQFPSEQALQMSRDIERSQKGSMINQQA